MTKNKKELSIKNDKLNQRIYTELEKVIDPELGIDIVNLGLINELNLYEQGLVEIKLTLTTMGCPFADQIQDDIKKAVENLEDVNEAIVKLVWYPAWTPDRMTRYARIALGIR